MKKFLAEDFLLDNAAARSLYFDYAEKMPIYDYHCHIPPQSIAEDKKFQNIAELWLGGDHYKWRTMRSNGVPERFVTGDASDYDKFKAWASTVPKCIGNPLYHWTHLELQRYFGITELLNESTAPMIWDRCNSQLRQDDFSVKNLIRRSKVQVMATTEDPLDDLKYHQQIQEDIDFAVKVSTAFRPDQAVEISQPGFSHWVKQLETVSELAIADSYTNFLQALEKRADYFHQHGCRLSDHALDDVYYRRGLAGEVESAFKKRINGQSLTVEEIEAFRTETLLFFGKLYHKLQWTMQLHIGAMRFNNTRMKGVFGYDSINDRPFARALALLLDALDQGDELPRTILYCLNPSDNEVIATMIGNFQDGVIPGKIQFGSGWWFNDTEEGIKRQLKALAELGLLSRFVGMLTDSRSFISYPRHEYFRRILCNMMGDWLEAGRVPDDVPWLGLMVQDICYNNAESYFAL